MTATQSHESLAAALAAFQATMPTVAKTKTANTGHFSYSYADLADLTSAAMPLLAAQGLAFSATPEVTDHGLVLTGRLLHTTGQELAGSLPVGGGSPQQIGSALTYMRRYLLGCLTGLVTDDDDDGQAAAPVKPRSKKPKPPAAQLLDPKSGLAVALYARLREAGIDKPGANQLYEDVTGRPVASSKELYEDEARRVLDELDTRLGPRPRPDRGEREGGDDMTEGDTR